MRQVPTHSTYTIIGNGRVARHFCYYLSLLHIPYQQWFRGLSDVPLLSLITDCTGPVLLLIHDAAIESFIQQHPYLKNICCVHFSGSLVTDLAYGVHPLMTFASELYSLEVYQRIPWIHDQTTPPFSKLLPGLPNASFVIDAQQRNYYHALCVMANNFTTILWGKFFKEMLSRFEIPAESLLPILQATMENIAKDPKQALTGPLVRGDQMTIDNNLASLEGDDFVGIYKAFVAAYANGQ